MFFFVIEVYFKCEFWEGYFCSFPRFQFVNGANAERAFLQFSTLQFVNGVIAEGSGGESELKEHVHRLVYELHKINPQLLLFILPTICTELQVTFDKQSSYFSDQ